MKFLIRRENGLEIRVQHKKSPAGLLSYNQENPDVYSTRFQMIVKIGLSVEMPCGTHEHHGNIEKLISMMVVKLKRLFNLYDFVDWEFPNCDDVDPELVFRMQR